MRGYRVLTFAKCTTIMKAELAVTSGLGSSFDYMGIGWDWFGESVRLCLNLCLLLDNNICLLLDITFVFCWTTIFVLYWTITFVLCWTTIFVFWWTITFVFCWTTILVFGGTMSSVGHYPLWTYFI
jgi:hypothetical protein